MIMNTRLFPLMTLVAILALPHSNISFAQPPAKPGAARETVMESQPLITFVELGSVKCIPCRQMQPVMKAVEKKYGTQIKVVFHDVWTDSGRPYAGHYKIRVIPTQVFLDVKGKEVFRHEGFFPETEIDKLVQKHGLKVIQTNKN